MTMTNKKSATPRRLRALLTALNGHKPTRKVIERCREWERNHTVKA